MPPTQAELAHINEPNLSALSDQEKKIYVTLREEDQVVYLAWRPTQRNAYNNWMGVFGYVVPVDITAAVICDVNRFEPIQPSTADFLAIRKYAYAQEKTRPVNKQYYKDRGFKIWDAMREYAGWKSQLDMICQEDTAASKAPNQPATQMTHDEAIQLKNDVITQTKQHGYDGVQSWAESSNDTWIVRVTWGNERLTLKSRSQWDNTFEEIYELAQNNTRKRKQKGIQ